MDAVNSFPALILALSIAAVLGPGLGNAMIAITVVLIPAFTRLTRGQALAVSQETYVEASRSIGTKTRTIIRKRIFPGVLSVLIVQASLILGTALIAEAGLSFLGLGIQPPKASWGGMLQRAFQTIYNHPYQMFVPGIAIGLAVLAFNNMGDALRDALGFQETRTRFGMKRGRLGMTSVKSPLTDPVPEHEALMSVQNLSVEFATSRGLQTVVDNVSFDVKHGEVVGLVGESGCGKSVTSLALMRLIGTPPGRIKEGRVIFDGHDLLAMPFDDLRDLRGHGMSMVFQDPMSSLNPAYTIGNLLVEAIRLHQNMPKAQAETRAAELLDFVGIPDARARLKEYPHRLSGGMRQRVLIAIALANNPKLVIADEPTTALDVTIQAQIIELLERLRQEFNMSLIFVTHDLGIVADICDRVVVMYAGQVVESAPVHELFAEPRHPYTRALLAAMPQSQGGNQRLNAIPGRVPGPGAWPVGCRFASRCPLAVEACTAGPIDLLPVDANRSARCIRHADLLVEAHQ
jgi:peptide/nickel transport system permease protein